MWQGQKCEKFSINILNAEKIWIKVWKMLYASFTNVCMKNKIVEKSIFSHFEAEQASLVATSQRRPWGCVLFPSKRSALLRKCFLLLYGRTFYFGSFSLAWEKNLATFFFCNTFTASCFFFLLLVPSTCPVPLTASYVGVKHFLEFSPLFTLLFPLHVSWRKHSSMFLFPCFFCEKDTSFFGKISK